MRDDRRMRRSLALVTALSLTAAAPASTGCGTIVLAVAPKAPTPVGIGAALAGDALAAVAASLSYKSLADSDEGGLPYFWPFFGFIVLFDAAMIGAIRST
jgi:hypothetical protein